MDCPKCRKTNAEDSRFCSQCGTVLGEGDLPASTLTDPYQASLKGLAVGSTFAGKYVVLQELGRGGMGRVYKAHDTTLDEDVALKLLRPEIASDRNTIERFKNELKTARRISHTHVCRMFDLNEEAGTYYLTMEFVPGEDLKTTIRRVGLLNLSKTIAIAKQICEGLSEAHRLDIVHRDLKPQNVMLDNKGNVRIMDFGISRSLQARGLTTDGIVVGTPEYMSPEQAAGLKIDQRTDIYSLGAILFEMVTGRVPFEGDTTLNILFKLKNEPPPDPRSLCSGLPESMSRLILRCLEKDRERRYQNVEDVFVDLEKIEKTVGTREATAEAPRKTARAIAAGKPFPVKIAAAGAGIVVLAAVLLVVFGRGPKTDLRRPMAEKTAPPGQGERQKADAAAAAAPQMANGRLDIQSVPSGAQVYIDDRQVGATPYQGEIPAGTHRLRVAKGAEFKASSESFTVKSGETFAGNFVLTPSPPLTAATKSAAFILHISTFPEGAEAKIDSVSYGQTPLTVTLAKSACRVSLSKGPEWIPVEETLELKPGDNSIRREMKPALFMLNLLSKPSGALVFVDGVERGETPMTLAISPGTHLVKVTSPGCISREEQVLVEADLKKTFTLEKSLPARITIKVYPFADIVLDGKPIGEAPPPRTQEIEAGKHRVEFGSSQLNKKYTVDFEIAGGESKEIRMNMETGESKITIIKEPGG